MGFENKLYVAFLWHMHQPYYKDISKNEYIMPWVRLHGTKDYLDMVLLLKDYPNVKMNFNLVPSLLEQLIDYTDNDAKDSLLTLSCKRAEDLTDEDRLILLKKFFMAHSENMIKPFPRYKELYQRRGWARTKDEFERILKFFTIEDFRDIQVLFNLAWIDPMFQEDDLFIKGIIEKGKYFTEEEKLKLLEKQNNLLKKIIPTYKEFQDKGQIEVSTTPFYHPILPLLINTEFAKRANPHTLLPHPPFLQPEDAEEHIKRSVDFYKKLFGQSPNGLWPSEGSVCPEIIPLINKYNFEWIATDEEILSLSLKRELFRRDMYGFLSNESAEILYQPYWIEHNDKRVISIFRDHFISDLIGFKYANWKSEDAANDLIMRLEKIAQQFEKSEIASPPIVSIILDGENCWEHYYRDGLNFLRTLYDKLNSHPKISTTTITDFINKYPPKKSINNIFTGSWIFHNFDIWIGHKEDIQYWEYLNETRTKVMEKILSESHDISNEDKENAYKCLLIAEGSDWAWWYGDDHSSGSDEEFDQLFRDHLINACKAVKIEIPPKLFVPITSEGETGRLILPKNYINPLLDGQDTNYFEWFQAGCYNPIQGGDSMHQVTHYIKKICFGFSKTDFFIRIDPDADLLRPDRKDEVEFAIVIYHPEAKEFSLIHPPKGDKYFMNIKKFGKDIEKTKIGEISSVSVGYLIEIAIPFSILGIKPNSIIHLQIIVRSNGNEIDKCPSRNPLSIMIPSEDYYSKLWFV